MPRPCGLSSRPSPLEALFEEDKAIHSQVFVKEFDQQSFAYFASFRAKKKKQQLVLLAYLQWNGTESGLSDLVEGSKPSRCIFVAADGLLCKQDGLGQRDGSKSSLF